jgi:hypothetical protein
LKSGEAVFYFGHPSLLNFQQEMKKKHKRSNLQTLFGVKEIPCPDQMTKILDEIEPAKLEGVFRAGLDRARESEDWKRFSVLDGGPLLAMDGTWYYSSEKIHCDHCLSITKDGKTTWYHDMVSVVAVSPDESVVLPLMPEFIRNEDGNAKQDCERSAAKRYIEAHKDYLRGLKPTFLGDALYLCYPICHLLDSNGMSFIFTCKFEGHPWIKDQVVGTDMESLVKEKVWNGRNHLTYRYKWLNGIEIRADGDNMLVNYLDFEVWNEEKKAMTYHNAWVTNKKITKDNVQLLAKCGRARWKIENEHNNVLKHHGYNLKHNFGHGENHASEVYCLLNLLAFLCHGLQDLADDDYKEARASFGRRDAFFWTLRILMSRFLFEDWHSFFSFVIGSDNDG